MFVIVVVVGLLLLSNFVIVVCFCLFLRYEILDLVFLDLIVLVIFRWKVVLVVICGRCVMVKSWIFFFILFSIFLMCMVILFEILVLILLKMRVGRFLCLFRMCWIISIKWDNLLFDVDFLIGLSVWLGFVLKSRFIFV